MNTLKQIQEEFLEHLYNPDNLKILDYISGTGENKLEQLEIYRNNLFEVLINALKENFPILFQLIGEESFRFAAKTYILENRSKSGNLDDFGKNLPGFLKNFEYSKDYEHLSDTAETERLVQLSYRAADEKTLDILSLQRVSEESLTKLRFQLIPSCFIIKSHWPIYELIVEKRFSIQIEYISKPQYILIFRKNGEVLLEKISQSLYLFIKEIKEGKCFYDIFDSVEKIIKDINIGKELNITVGKGLIEGFSDF